MRIIPGIFNFVSLGALLTNYKGALRNLIFLLLFWLAGYYFGGYLLEQSDKYYDNSNSIDPNPSFGYFLIAILALDFIAYFIKYKSIQYYVYHHKDYFNKRMGCLSIMESFMIGAAIMFNMVPTIWLIKIIFPALPSGSFVFPFILLFMILKWAIVAYKGFYMTPNKKEGSNDVNPQKPLPVLDKTADIILTLTTTVLYTVTCAVTRILREHHDFSIFFRTNAPIKDVLGYPLLLCFYAVALYLPTRLIFIMEDYYALTNPKYRRAAFLTSVFFILFSVLNTLVHTTNYI